MNAIADRRHALRLALGAGALACAPAARAQVALPEKAEDAIRNLCARFADSAVRRDLDAFGALWAENGVWTIGPPNETKAVGRNAIVAMLARLLGPWELFVQMPHSGVIRIDGSRARARWIVQEVGRSADARPYNNFAFYDDDLLGEDGAWRFAARRYHYLWLDQSTPVPGLTLPLPTLDAL